MRFIGSGFRLELRGICLLFRDRRAGTTSLRVNPNALNFPFISSNTAAFASESLLCKPRHNYRYTSAEIN